LSSVVESIVALLTPEVLEDGTAPLGVSERDLKQSPKFVRRRFFRPLLSMADTGSV